MANLAVGEVYAITTGTYTINQWGLMILHYRVTAVTGASVTPLAVAVGHTVNVEPVLKPLMGEPATYWGTRVQRVRPLPQGVAIVYSGLAGSGTGGLTCLPTQVCGLISAATAIAGRDQRARAYVPFPAMIYENFDTMGPTAAYVNGLVALKAALYSPFTITTGANNATLQPVVYHRATFSTSDILTSVARDKWATQRSRGNYGRANTPPPF